MPLLVYTGFKLLNPKQLRDLWKVGKSEAAIYLTTLTIIVSVDLLVGVIVGVALSAGKLLHRFSHLDVELKSDEANHRYQLKLAGAATFLRLPILAEQLNDLPGDAELHVCLDKVWYIDHACFELLMNWAKSHMADGGSLVMTGNSCTVRFIRRKRLEPASAFVPLAHPELENASTEYSKDSLLSLTSMHRFKVENQIEDGMSLLESVAKLATDRARDGDDKSSS